MPLIIAAVPASKADNRPRPDMDALRGMEDDATERIHAALQKWARAIFRDVTGDRVALLMTRLDDPDIVRPLRDALIAVLQDVAESGADFGREQIEQAVYGIKRTATVDPGAVDWTAANADAARWATEYGYLLVNGITDTTRARIANEIRYFVDNSLTINQLRDRLMEGSLFNRTRAKAIAVTEVTRAYAEGNTAAWQASGLVEGREWVTANDEMVCPICGPLHGTIAKMGEAFRGLYRNPPAHVNCRCVVLPVVITDTEEFGGMWRFPQAPREEWGGAAGGATVPLANNWRPAMSKEDAEKWASQSEFTEVAYHGTSKERAATIVRDGFNWNEEISGRYYGDGAYFVYGRGAKAAAGRFSEIATRYETGQYAKGGVLEVKINAPRVKDLSASGAFDRFIVDELMPGLQITDRMEIRAHHVSDYLKTNGYQAMITKESGVGQILVVFDPKAITVVQ